MTPLELANYYKLVYAILRRAINDFNVDGEIRTAENIKVILGNIEGASFERLLKMHKEIFGFDYNDIVTEDEFNNGG